ncbi:MAG: ATP synthase subunit I [Gammaproteobacteria bacterium]
MIPDLGPARSAGHLRRLAIVAVCLTVAAVAIMAPFGHLATALFGCLGLGLGLLNMALIQRSAARFVNSDDPNRKRKGTVNVLGRLAVITAFAVAIALLFRPDGFAVFGGLVVFQLLMIVTTLVPLVKEMRRTGAQA